MARPRRTPFTSPLQTPREAFLFGLLLGILGGLGGGVYLTQRGVNVPLFAREEGPQVTGGSASPTLDREILENRLRVMSQQEREALLRDVERPYRPRIFEPAPGGTWEAVSPDDERR